MHVLSSTIFVLVLLSIGNIRGDSFIDNIKQVINKAGEALKTLSGEFIGKTIEEVCDKGLNKSKTGLEFMSKLKCDEKDSETEFCKKVNDGHSIMDMMCCLGNEQRQIATEKFINCFEFKDQTEQKGCFEGFIEWLQGLKEVTQMAVKSRKTR